MGQKKFPQIKKYYSFHSNLLSVRKSIFKEVIEINKTENHHKALESIEEVSRLNVKYDKMVCFVYVKVNNSGYSFVLLLMANRMK